MRIKKTLVIFVAGVAMICIPAGPLQAAEVDRTTLQIGNILGTAVTTLLKGFIQGRVHDVKDAGRMLLYGGMAGYGFYQAKAMISRGALTSGIVLANLSASVCENVAWGEHPLAYIGYSLGPARVKLATPLARSNHALFHINLSVKQVTDLVFTVAHADHFRFQHGLVCFQASQRLNNGAIGWTKGLYPTVLQGTPDYVFQHEIVHVVQNLQLSCVSPYEPLLRDPGTRRHPAKSLFWFEGFKVDLLSVASDLSYMAVNYENAWQELEAYHFASGTN